LKAAQLAKKKNVQGSKVKNTFLEYVFDTGNDMFVFSVLDKDINLNNKNTADKIKINNKTKSNTYNTNKLMKGKK
jgi:hypothetical protein